MFGQKQRNNDQRHTFGGATMLILFLSLLFASFTLADLPTPKHEAGRCAVRGTCKKSFFSSDLPCADNDISETPSDTLREQIVGICGDKWKDGNVCCSQDQVNGMQKQLKRVNAFLSTCPACQTNFYNLFCEFTCSPDQSLFLNVTSVDAKSAVLELDYYLEPSYGRGFYDSCKDVKVSATNGFAMDLIGGGAKDYSAFLKFLGDKKFAGSPFQMNFPLNDNNTKAAKPLLPMHDIPKQCNDTDTAYRCACVDCAASCKEPEELKIDKACHVGIVPCLSFGVIVVYTTFLVSLLVIYSFHVAFQRHRQHKHERLRLLQDAPLSDDEDEGDILAASGLSDNTRTEYSVNKWLDTKFLAIGRFCAAYPALTIGTSVLVVALMSLGWLRFQVETDPVRLWVSPKSETAIQKQFFDDNFGPFFRAEQAFLVNDTDSEHGRVLSYDTLHWWFDVENRVQRLKSLKHGVTLDDVCFKPTGEACVVQSLTGYFGGDINQVSPRTWASDLNNCANQPVNCLPDFGQPLKKELLFGGYGRSGDVSKSQAIVVTWVVANHAEGSNAVARAEDWEQSLENLLIAVQQEAQERGLRLSFNTEISLEQELNKSTNTDAKIVVVSYIFMFIYASLALGSSGLALSKLISNPSKAFVDSKFTLGIMGIVIVLMSVSASVGLFSALGVKVTLIIAEVIPFLVLAVGVDNIFLITHEFDRANASHPDLDVEYRISKALGRMGPSILLSALTEVIAFALGAVVAMPAVRNFAIYAAGAVLINALLQMTMFVSVLCLNQKRQESNRFDCVPCIVAPGGPIRLYIGEEESYLQAFIRKTYAPALLGRYAKGIILIVFLGIFSMSIALSPEVELGLDQRIAIPSDSYLIDYFNDLYDYFDSGPPVYFVTKGYNATHRSEQKALCGKFPACGDYSMLNILEQERKRPEVSYLAEPAASWIDDFFVWLNPEASPQCCFEKIDGSGFCRGEQKDCKICFEDRKPAWNVTLHGMPEGSEFQKYLKHWLKSIPDEDCPIAGSAAYSNALVVDYDNLDIPASHFRTSHTSLHNQSDFINAFAAAKRIAKSISDSTGAEVFPYSKFYIFFDQYSTIVRLTISLIGGALAAVLVVTSVLLGSIKTGVVVTVTVLMIVVDIVGAMALWGVSLNAVSLVNLLICVGIGVEFCAHIARAFMFPSRTLLDKAKKMAWKDARAWVALVNVGPSVFSGITITKLLGVSVLAFTRSKIFEIYYFRIWLSLVIVAASHALIFLPVMLSIFGGEGYLDADSDMGLEEDLANRQYRNLLPNDYEDDSDDDERGYN